MSGSKLSCKLASNGLSLQPSGVITPCCQYLFGDDSTPKLNYKQVSKFNRVVRPSITQDLDRGIQHKNCSICWKQESVGKPSLRQKANEFLSHCSGKNQVFELELEFGNLCNLKCVMCGPYASSSWLTEISANFKLAKQLDLQIASEEPDSKGNTQVNKSAYPNKWWTEPELDDFIKTHVATAEHINVAGGEPLMSPKFDYLCEQIIEKTKPLKLFQVITNLTCITDRQIDLIKQIQLAHPASATMVGISLEGTQDHYNYLRYPGNWQEVSSNINKVVEMANLNKNMELVVYHTLQPASTKSLLPLAEFCKNKKINLQISPVHHAYVKFEATNPQTVEQFLQQLHSDKNLSNENKTICTQAFQNIEYSSSKREQYQRYIKFLDKVRNTNYESLFGTL